MLEDLLVGSSDDLPIDLVGLNRVENKGQLRRDVRAKERERLPRRQEILTAVTTSPVDQTYQYWSHPWHRSCGARPKMVGCLLVTLGGTGLVIQSIEYIVAAATTVTHLFGVPVVRHCPRYERRISNPPTFVSALVAQLSSRSGFRSRTH